MNICINTKTANRPDFQATKIEILDAYEACFSQRPCSKNIWIHFDDTAFKDGVVGKYCKEEEIVYFYLNFIFECLDTNKVSDSLVKNSAFHEFRHVFNSIYETELFNAIGSSLYPRLSKICFESFCDEFLASYYADEYALLEDGSGPHLLSLYSNVNFSAPNLPDDPAGFLTDFAYFSSYELVINQQQILPYPKFPCPLQEVLTAFERAGLSILSDDSINMKIAKVFNALCNMVGTFNLSPELYFGH